MLEVFPSAYLEVVARASQSHWYMRRSRNYIESRTGCFQVTVLSETGNRRQFLVSELRSVLLGFPGRKEMQITWAGDARHVNVFWEHRTHQLCLGEHEISWSERVLVEEEPEGLPERVLERPPFLRYNLRSLEGARREYAEALESRWRMERMKVAASTMGLMTPSTLGMAGMTLPICLHWQESSEYIWGKVRARYSLALNAAQVQLVRGDGSLEEWVITKSGECEIGPTLVSINLFPRSVRAFKKMLLQSELGPDLRKMQDEEK